MAGLLGDSIDDPRTMAVFAGIQGLLGGRGLAQGMANGLLNYGGQMQQAKQQAQRDEMLKQQMQMQALTMQQRQLALQEAQRQAAMQKQIEDAAAASRGQLSPATQALAGGGGPTVGNAAKMEGLAPAFDWAGYANRVTNINPERGLQLQQMLKKEQAKIKDYKEVRMPDGSVQIVGFDEYGKPVDTGRTPFKDAQEMNLGGTVGLRDPITNKIIQEYKKSVSPDTVFSGTVTMRGQDMTDSRARDLNAITREGQQTQIVNDPLRGPLLINKGTGLARQAVGLDGKPIPGEIPAKREASAKSLVPIIQEAEALITGSTGSTAGALIDKGAAFFGGATDGAKNVARLKVLEGHLMMNQPRMEGPQSDKDVAMYRQMAAQIGDPNTPNSIKQAALATIKSLNDKYAGVSSSGAIPDDIQAILKSYNNPQGGR